MEEAYVSLADAILLGSAITEARAYDLNHCALGMAANAVGIPKTDPFAPPYSWTPEGGIVVNRSRFDQLRERWPWLLNMYKRDYHLPDTCWNWIADTFNHKVCPELGAPTMTLEELCAEVRKMEAQYVIPQPSLDTVAVMDKIATAEELIPT